jgi:hypothetical protein
MVSDVCQVQHLNLELADGYRSLYYMVGGSLWILRVLPPLKLVTMI